MSSYVNPASQCNGNHKWQYDEDVSVANCTTPKKVKQFCPNCTSTQTVSVGTALGHDWYKTSVANIGEIKTCRRCGVTESNVQSSKPTKTPISVATEFKDTTKPIVYEGKFEGNKNQEMKEEKIKVWDNVRVTRVAIRGEDKPKHGTVSNVKIKDNSTVIFDYMPNKDFTGTDEFYLTVYDAAGNKSEPGKQKITIKDSVNKKSVVKEKTKIKSTINNLSNRMALIK